VLETTREEHRAPAPPVVAPELEVVLLAGHAGDHIINAAPGIEAVVEPSRLGLARLDAQEAEGRA